MTAGVIRRQAMKVDMVHTIQLAPNSFSHELVAVVA